ncbi:hypothetical protein KNU05_gp120 [Synechococcus virus S-PRM1]|jgi:hypothetical protein|uniref:Uncharacterized protein n=1 Tax=Synechococcus virus S-PRM1 TaxID=2100130 RepID=A0A346FKC9_9CAUD|nr:hypothetical protein KNU05_gp120 [Synechococcus virus S-PRM1]AXN58434.1 hypothetical protein [Synechococcus virus S-PRM1]
MTKTMTKTKLPPNPLLTEVLTFVSKQRSKAKKVEALKEYDTDALRAILIWNYEAVSMLPEGEVPYSPNEAPKGTEHQQLSTEYKRLYHFVKGGNDSLKSLRRESMFIQLLEGLHADEANLLCKVKDRRLEEDYKITIDIVKEAYPDVKWGWRK